MDSLHDSIADANSAASTNANAVPPFLSKTYDMVDDASTNEIVSWSNGNNSFVVWNVPEFARDLLPKYFKHNNFSSFVRQLNTYGFRKVDPDRWEFANEGFLRGQKHLLKSISRRKPAHAQSNQQPQVQNSSVGACVEVGKFGLEEEVERLKRDKNVLMQELVRLRQQQQATDSQLQTVGQRVQVMEQRQQQMMSFLAKAMQSPDFLNQLVQQQTDSNRRISGGNKKRRLPRQGEGDMPEPGTVSPNGQIIKYQPSINEAAKAMLHQILKMNTSPRLDPSMNNHSAFLIDGIPSSNPLGNKTASSRTSGVTLSEVPLASKQPYVAVDSGFPDIHPSTANCATTGCSKADPKEVTFQNVLQMEGVPGNSDGLSEAGLVGPENGSMEYIDSISAAFDGTVPGETDEFCGDHDMGTMLDDAPKLPGINDIFWEQFLAASPLTGDTDEINSSSLDSGMTTEQDLPTGKENVWDNVKHMDNLAAQMGLLASEGTNG